MRGADGCDCIGYGARDQSRKELAMRVIQVPLLMLTLSVGCTTMIPVGDEQAAITGGTVDNGDPTVGLFWRPDNREGCTGTLLNPHVVLTAAHCLNNLNVGVGTRPQF